MRTHNSAALGVEGPVGVTDPDCNSTRSDLGGTDSEFTP